MEKILIIILIFTAEVLKAQDFSVSAIPDAVFQRMEGRSWPKNGLINRDSYRYLRVVYVNEKGEKKQGEIVCGRSVADDLLNIFRELYAIHYPIHSIRLVDDFGANDECSMKHNNTSCFNYRRMSGRRRLSKHSMGIAVDINPLWNPNIHTNGRIEPANASRSHIITKDDPCYKIFRKHGWHWGGSWHHNKDYQHFEK